jgi:hypothetical protein
MIVVHGISLPPGEFGGPEIEALFTNTLDWCAHPYFEEIRGMVYLLRNGRGMQVNLAFVATIAATTFRLVSSSRARTKFPMTIGSIRCCKR